MSACDSVADSNHARRHVRKVPDSDIDLVGRILIPVDPVYALPKPARAIGWFLRDWFGAIYTDDLGRQPLPKRMKAG